MSLAIGSLAIGIITKDREADLARVLQSLRQLTLPYQLIIVNNGSRCVRSAVAAAQGPACTLLYHYSRRDLGISLGRHTVLSLSDARYFLLLDDDTVVGNIQQLVERTLAYLEQNDRCGAVAYQLLEPASQRPRTSELPTQQRDFETSAAQDVCTFVGACHALRRDAVFDVGGYAQDFVGWGYEDKDLARRLIHAGWSIRYLPEPVYHLKSATSRACSRHAVLSHYRNSSLFITRHLRLRDILLGVFLRGLLLSRHVGRFPLYSLLGIWSECLSSFRLSRQPFHSSYFATIRQRGERVW
ncbi:MAG: glycosyltransferase [Bdellovibrionales bacterium]|nr:glycosyltransferase [Bdellovibrionales bacterium]